MLRPYPAPVHVLPGAVHEGGDCGRRGGEDLHLLRVRPQIPVHEIRQLLHVPLTAAWVGGHEVVCQELVLPLAAVGPIEHVLEVKQDVRPGLPHAREHLARDVLRGDLQLPGNVVLHDAVHIILPAGLVGHDHVEAYPRGHEHLLHPRHCLYAVKEAYLSGMVDAQRGAGPGVQALPVRAGALLSLPGAFDAVHVGRRAPDVVDDAVEARSRCDPLCFCDDRIRGAGDHPPALMDGYGAERAFPVAPAVGGDGVLDSVHRPDHAVPGIVGMDGVLVVKHVDPVELLGRQAALGRVLDEETVAVPLSEALCGRRVAIMIEDAESVRELRPVGGAFLVGRHLDESLRDLFPDAAYPPNAAPVPAVPHAFGKFEVRQLRHPVGYGIGLGIEEDAPAQGVRPEIVVDDPPQAGLDASEDYRLPLGVPADQVGVRDAGAVGAPVVDPAGGEIILLPELPGRGVVGHHGIDAARGHGPEQLGHAQAGYVAAVGDRGLADDPDPEPVIDQPVADDGRAVVRRIYVGVAGDDDDVEGAPSPRPDLFGHCRYEHPGSPWT